MKLHFNKILLFAFTLAFTAFSMGLSSQPESKQKNNTKVFAPKIIEISKSVVCQSGLDIPVSDSEPIEMEDEDKDEDGKKENSTAKFLFIASNNILKFNSPSLYNYSKTNVVEVVNKSPLYLKYRLLLI